MPSAPGTAAAPAILTPPAIVVWAYEPEWDVRLHPAEEHVVAGARVKRRREFAAGRNCARHALCLLGVPRVAIPSGRRREPVWPPGIRGSITHCADCCGAAVVRESDLAAVGLDVERNGLAPAGITAAVCSPQEHAAAAAALAASSTVDVDAALLLFSAKEAVFKAWHPLTGLWLDFLDVAVELHPRRNSFSVEFRRRAVPAGMAPLRFEGRYALSASHVFTGVAVS